jgi:hypothetical protein
MTTMLPPGLLEANRLTREGRLTEATALLQRLFNNETASAPPAGTAAGAAAPPTGPRPRVFDVNLEASVRSRDARHRAAGIGRDLIEAGLN